MPSKLGVQELPILIVEDDPGARGALAAGLEFSGFRVVTAGNGEEALREIEREVPALVLLDMNMPVLDGWGFAQRLAERGYKLPIIVMTTDPTHAEQVGALAWLPKPIDWRLLLSHIAEVVDVPS